MWRTPFPTPFFYGGGDFVNQIWSQQILYPKKICSHLFTLASSTNWPRSVQLDVLPAALLTVTRGTQGGGELEKIRGHHEVPKVVNDPNDLMQFLFPFPRFQERKNPVGSEIFSVLFGLCGKLHFPIRLLELYNSKGDI